ncbi:hypothetical protein HYFRA_00013020 [Hymenoscyphus fraxineus]|uniref:Uncharacterized protein n=1 Tax=Hymenoscyphus fraxineus TaxID=746836 RepID=A0A9N9L3B6_9HELO|nr:hypothetical protein HYFRA_00013020 [Hymenoscyphus fraxineus]
MSEWLRPVFTRTRTPVQGNLPAFDLDRPSLSAEEHYHDYEEKGNMTGTIRMRPSSRVSSYIGFRPNTPPTATHDVFQRGTASFENPTRDPGMLYHKPSNDQMAETLKVIMMTRSNLEPVPVEYNYCILHVLEAYQDLTVQVNAKQEIIDELKKSHTKDIKEFEVLATQWEKKEQDYKAELKKLEVLLSKTEGGMESVVMARSNSRIHGAKRASDEMRRSIGTIKERHVERSSMGEPGQNVEDPNFMAEHSMGLPRIDTSVPSVSHWTYPAEQKRDLPHLTSTSEMGSDADAMSSTDSYNEGSTRIRARGLGFGLDKPLPDMPVLEKPSHRNRRAKAKTDPTGTELPLPQQLSFSFKPGDDSSLSVQRESSSYSKQKMLDDLMRHRRSVDPTERSETPTTNTTHSKDSTVSPSRTHTPINNMRPESRTTTINTATLQTPPEREPISRGTSTNSVITAIRDNSGRSSVAGSRTGRPSNDRSGGSDEAITAAARAFKNSGKNGSGPKVDRTKSPQGTDGQSEVELLVKNLAEKRREKGNGVANLPVNKG